MEVFVALVFLAIPVWVIVKLKLVTNDLAHIKNNMEKDRINAVNAREEHYYDIASLIGGIRIENVSNVSNIVNQYKAGVIDSESFIKEIGECKVIKVTDKVTGKVTNVNYDRDGVKESSETFDGEILVMRLDYSSKGNLKRGMEYDSDGNKVAEYVYDYVGEISKKIEYHYTDGNKVSEKVIDY